ncbi:DNA recombination protein RmuC homolog [Verrucomicrobia bacterium]|nr:DNA recombination protein RmuC homolog [Verrucomicrobiota bacterium]
MSDLHSIILLAAIAAVGVLQILLLRKRNAVDFTPVLRGLEDISKSQERTERSVRDDIAKNRAETATAAREARLELAGNLKAVGDTLNQQLAAFSEQLGNLTQSSQQRLESLKDAVEARLKSIQEDNTKQLDQMRATVDEKLQGTLEKRLGESFKQVSEWLEQVHKGLGEMQTLATGVGDLKKVLTNVKTRGTWGEVQLGAMLEQVLAPDQYAANVATKGEGERVEFAVKLPGRGPDGEEAVWLPIDAKFPVEDYQRLLEAEEKADPEAAEQAARQLETRIKQCAKDICDKYLAPPKTTDFAILYLPTEGLFAEVIRRVGLPEYVQRQCRVVIAGPTTLWSILNSLQMGFRTLAIEKRSSEVWKVLAAVKAELTRFGSLLEGVKKKLDAASSTIDEAAQKSRTIQRKLRSVQHLPASDAETVLEIESGALDSAGDGAPETAD